jgi:fluoride exporter
VSTPLLTLWVALAGSAGALARFVVDGAVKGRWATVFPVGTLLINISGSLLLGLLTGLALFHGEPGAVRTIAGTGFCGGYTTFSTASFETVRLLQQGHRGRAGANAVGTLLLTVLAGAAGLLLGRLA